METFQLEHCCFCCSLRTGVRTIAATMFVLFSLNVILLILHMNIVNVMEVAISGSYLIGCVTLFYASFKEDAKAVQVFLVAGAMHFVLFALRIALDVYYLVTTPIEATEMDKWMYASAGVELPMFAYFWVVAFSYYRQIVYENQEEEII